MLKMYSITIRDSNPDILETNPTENTKEIKFQSGKFIKLIEFQNKGDILL